MKHNQSITRHSLQMAFIRIGIVVTLASVISYFVNKNLIEKSIHEQLILSTQERLQRESIPFTAIKAFHQNFIAEFNTIYENPVRCQELARDFDHFFYIRPKDNSYQERPEIFDGTKQVNGQYFTGTSASFPPNKPLSDDAKARFTLIFNLTHKYGVITEGYFFDMFASIPEGGWTSHWAGNHDSEEEDYLSPDYVNVETLEWFQLGHNSAGTGSALTKIYFDDTMKLWMVSLVSFRSIQGKKQLFSVGTDFVLDQLINRTAKPSIIGSNAIIFCNDEKGTLIYHPEKKDEILKTTGNLSIQSLNDLNLLPVLNILKEKKNVDSAFTIEDNKFITVFGNIPDTNWCMAIQYPKSLMRPAILQNLNLVAAVGLITLLVELIILRSILQNQVSKPLAQLLSATRKLGTSRAPIESNILPTETLDEIGELAQNFATMAKRIQNTRDQLEETVATRTQELEKAKNEANFANDAKTMFLANMSHEIRTPTHGILGMTNSLRRAGVTPQQEDKLKKMEVATHHLLEIINSILDLSKIEAGKINLEELPIDIKSIFTNIMYILSDSAKSKNINLIVENQEWPLNLCGDAIRIQQALLNFGINAIKFTEKGMVTFRAFIQEENSDNLLMRFEVMDSGIGILPEKLPHLFKDYVQADHTLTSKQEGTGLGLAITRKLAELMGGESGVQSTHLVGSTFWFTVRLKKKIDNISAKLSKLKPNAELIIKNNYAGSRILIIDDEPLNLELIKTLLEEAQLKVSTSIDGFHAIAKAKEIQFDLLFMDLHMPKLGGIDAAKLIKQIPGYQSTPIIAMTANTFVENKNICIEAGMADFLIKPFGPEILFEKTLYWLEKKKLTNHQF